MSFFTFDGKKVPDMRLICRGSWAENRTVANRWPGCRFLGAKGRQENQWLKANVGEVMRGPEGQVAKEEPQKRQAVAGRPAERCRTARPGRSQNSRTEFEGKVLVEAMRRASS